MEIYGQAAAKRAAKSIGAASASKGRKTAGAKEKKRRSTPKPGELPQWTEKQIHAAWPEVIENFIQQAVDGNVRAATFLMQQLGTSGAKGKPQKKKGYALSLIKEWERLQAAEQAKKTKLAEQTAVMETQAAGPAQPEIEETK